MSVSLTHIALHCEDIDASVAFYRDWCSMNITHDRVDDGVRVAWLAEPGKENEFIMVLIGGGNQIHTHPEDFSHLGFDVPERSDVDIIAARAAAINILAWPARELPPPVGYFCGVADPDGRVVEFSHGQPIGYDT
jgi:catechol 2,3-dioxygenase-like lactoylglutathione lyase family enzyme